MRPPVPVLGAQPDLLQQRVDDRAAPRPRVMPRARSSGSATMSATRRRGLSDPNGSWKTICMSARARGTSRPRSRVMSRPSKRIVPPVGVDDPQQRRGRAWTCRSRTRRPAPASRPRRSRGRRRRPPGRLAERRPRVARRPGVNGVGLLHQASTSVAAARRRPGDRCRRTAGAVLAAPARRRRAANAHRGANAQPGGRRPRSAAAGDGRQPVQRPDRPPAASSPSSASVYGCRGREQHLRRAVPCSTIRPAYITATRSAISATTPRSWVMSRIAGAVLGLEPLAAARRICAWIVTSSAVVGSSAISTAGSFASADRDHHALAHPAGELVRVRVRGARRVAMPTSASSSSARAQAPLARHPPVGADHLGRSGRRPAASG